MKSCDCRGRLKSNVIAAPEIHLGTQVFSGEGAGNRIVFTVEVSNYGEENVRVDLSELTGTSSISIAYDYKVRTQSNDTVTSDKQHAVVYNNETLTIEITCILIDEIGRASCRERV